MAYIIAEGEVVRTFFDGKGLTFKEVFTKRDGTEGAAYFTAFFTEPHGLDEGDTATFKGNISVTLVSYEKDGETKYTAKATINNTKAEDVLASVSSGAEAAVVQAGF
jgi:hypothetical protein